MLVLLLLVLSRPDFLLLALYSTVLMLCSTEMVKMAWDLLDCSFSSVPPVARAKVPASSSFRRSSGLLADTSRAPALRVVLTTSRICIISVACACAEAR